jgi:ferredoxin
MTKTGTEDIYRSLSKKIDNLTVRAPWNDTFYNILKKLYTPEEADVVVRMPYILSTADRISGITGVEKTRLQGILDKLSNKGLLLDIYNAKDGQYYFMPSPVLIGLFEFTMMRTGNSHEGKEYAKLFQNYLAAFYPANFSQGEQVSILRVIPIEETVKPEDHIAFMDYEKVSSLIENTNKFALGICSCRNEKFHNGEKECDAPLDNCSAFGIGADYLIRHNMGREVSKSEMIDNFARSKELGLVFSADNTKRNPMVVCQCCKCCCNYLAGANKFGFTNSVVTSNFVSSIDEATCTGCGKCVKVCPVNAVSLVTANNPLKKKKKKAKVDSGICVGCGVCAFKCSPKAMMMINRGIRVIHPETTFERIILLSLERGNLQNQLFDNPQSMTQNTMRLFVGSFLNLTPVKRALMSDLFRSSFLSSARGIARMQGKGWMLEL